MKRPHFLLRLTALFTSVLLIGGLVAYRAGAFDSASEASEPTPEPESKHQPVHSDTDRSRSTAVPWHYTFTPSNTNIVSDEPTYFSGPKAPSRLARPEKPSKSETPTLMNGSKVQFTPVISVPKQAADQGK